MSPERSAREEMMRRLAFYDPLTGLANRRLLQQRLARPWSRLPAAPGPGLHRSRPLQTHHDTFGHETGDLLLKLVAERMGSASEKTWWHALGDEFVIMLPDTGCPRPSRSPTSCTTACITPSSLSRQALHLRQHRVAPHPITAPTPRPMHHADQAMYRQAPWPGQGLPVFHRGSSRHPAMAARPRMRPPRIDVDHRQLYLLANRLLEHMGSRHPSRCLAGRHGADIRDGAPALLLKEQVPSRNTA